MSDPKKDEELRFLRELLNDRDQTIQRQASVIAELSDRLKAMDLAERARIGAPGVRAPLITR